MRELMFRAWDTEKKCWIPGAYGFHILGESMLIGGLFHDYKIEKLNNIEITQFTGLKDKNGKEIYEGDIVDYGVWENGDGERAVIAWHDELARFGLDFFSKYGREGYTGRNTHLVDYLKNMEIIGNIYQTQQDGGGLD
jgi:uncharacterized phage protein (TIGR01671 family)